jgi:hypothetical protein
MRAIALLLSGNPEVDAEVSAAIRQRPELALRQDNCLDELFPAQADGVADLVVCLAGPGRKRVAGHTGWAGALPQLHARLLGDGALAPLLGALELWCPPHPVDAAAGLEDQIDERLGAEVAVVGDQTVLAGVAASHVPVESEYDSVDDGGLAGPGGPVEKEETTSRELGEVDVLLVAEWPQRREGQGVQLHQPLRSAARTAS